MPAATPELSSGLTLKRVFDSDAFKVESPTIRWDKSDDILWELRDDGAGNSQLIKTFPANRSAGQLIASASDFRIQGETEAPAIQDFQWSDDHQYLLAYVNSQKVWRTNTKGEYRLLELASGDCRRLGAKVTDANDLMFATFSPTSGEIAFVHDQSLYVESVQTGEVRPVSLSKNPNEICGTFDWVYEEELGLKNGFRIRSDGKSISYWRLDQSKVPRHTLIDNTSNRYPTIKTFAYPKVGQTNPAATVHVWHSESNQSVQLKIPGDPRENYLASMEWVPDQGRLLVQQLNRRQNRNRVWLADGDTGDCVLLHEETSKGWLEPLDDLHWITDESPTRLLWSSERSGWRHLETIALPGTKTEVNTWQPGPPSRLTRGPFDVISIDAFDSATNRVYFTAAPDNASTRQLYRCDIAQQGDFEMVLVSPNKHGTYEYLMSPSAKFAVQTWSSFSSPPTTSLIELRNPTNTLEVIEDNAKITNAIKSLPSIKEEFLKLEIEPGVSLDAWLMLPDSATPRKRVPLVVYMYGEPAGQTVRDRFSTKSYLWHRYLTQIGIAVATIDNRGVASPRGRDFRQAIYRKIGILPPHDQAMAIRVLIDQYEMIDPSRIAAWGWSGGGSSSLNSVFRHPDLFSAAIAIAPVSDQRDYDTIYQERYMGLLADNEAAYLEGSPITHAHKLADPLLLIHGTSDDNVHVASSERLINELVKHGKPFDLMLYPGRTHAVSEGDGTTLHLRQTMTDFLIRHLKPSRHDGKATAVNP